MKTKTAAALIAFAALLAAGRAEALGKSALVGFWKGSLENNSGNLNAYSAQMEIHFASDGKFESRKLTSSPSIYDDSLILRKDQWKGTWKLKGDSLVLKVDGCVMGGNGPSVETCEYLAEADSLHIFQGGLPAGFTQEKHAAQFTLPSLGGTAMTKDRSWALGLGESSKVYPEPVLEAGAKAFRRTGALAGLFLPSTNFTFAN